MLSLLLTLALAQPVNATNCKPGYRCRISQAWTQSSGANPSAQFCQSNNTNAIQFARASQMWRMHVASTCSAAVTETPIEVDTLSKFVSIGSPYSLSTTTTTYLAGGASHGTGGLTLGSSQIATFAGYISPTNLPLPSTTRGFTADASTNRLWKSNTTEWIEVGGAPHSVSERVQYLIVSDRTAGANAAAWAVAPRAGGANVTFTTAGTLSNATGPGTEPWTNYATTAVSGNQAHHSSAAWFAPGNRMTSRVGPGGVITSIRLFHGMSGTRPLTAGSATPTAHAAVFRFDTSAGDTNWMACTGAGVALTCTSTGVPVVASSDLNATLTIDCREASALGIPTACTFWVDNIPRVRVTTNLPAALMGHTHSVETLTAASRDFRFGSISVETR